MREYLSLFTNFAKRRYNVHSCNFSVSNKNFKPPWKVLFFGSDYFAIESLKMLYTEMKSQRLIRELSIVCAQLNCPVAKFGLEKNLKLLHWKPSINQIIDSQADVGLVASFGHLIPSKIISAFPLGMVNVHASILPRWRGAAPIVHAVMNRDKVTGVSIMKIRPHKFDEGEILRTASCDIGPHETAATLTQRLSIIGAQELRKCLETLPECLSQAKSQPLEGATYAPKIGPSMAICDWVTMSAEEIYGRHLALAHIHPLQTSWRGQPLKLLECSIAETQDGVPGTVTFDWKQRQLIISCKDHSAVKVNRVKLPNKPAISAVDFLNGYLKKSSKNMWRFNDDLKS